jgi:hypothetical protein
MRIFWGARAPSRAVSDALVAAIRNGFELSSLLCLCRLLLKLVAAFRAAPLRCYPEPKEKARLMQPITKRAYLSPQTTIQPYLKGKTLQSGFARVGA